MIEANVSGNVTRDPELKQTAGGKSMARFGLASSYKRGDRQNTTFVDVVCFDEMADVVAESVKKGDRLMVTGRMELQTYEKRDGTAGASLNLVANEIGKSMRFLPRDGEAVQVHRQVEFTDGIPF